MMSHPLSDIARHGYIALGIIVFLEAIGIPVPAALALIAAGAAAAAHDMRAELALGFAFAAILAGDTLMYMAGRLSGWGMLSLLCRVSLNPESCIWGSAQRFHRRGKLTLVLAKFIPGINTMAPPMAGSMRMRLMRFLAYDSAGAAIYVLGCFALGYVFGGVIDAAYRRAEALSRAVEWIAIAAALGYIAYRAIVYWTHRRADVAPRVSVQELAELLRESPDQLLVADVRSHGYYDRGAKRIAGSIHLDPSSIVDDTSRLARDREIYLYCT